MRLRRLRIVLGIMTGMICVTLLAPPVALDRIDGTPKPTVPWNRDVLPTGSPAAATRFLARPGGMIAYDDTGTPGPLVVCVPSMGDLRQEYRFLASRRWTCAATGSRASAGPTTPPPPSARTSSRSCATWTRGRPSSSALRWRAVRRFGRRTRRTSSRGRC